VGEDTSHKPVKVLLWNVEGLKSILRNMPEYILLAYPIIIPETFIRESIHINGYYSCHSFALQGETGSPIGAIKCVIKP
jgi:hypothetical protein